MAEYIAREETMKRIREIGDENYKGKYPHIGMVHAEKIVSFMPSADVAPVVHGEWMRHRNELWCYCSVCLEDALMSRSTGAEVLSETCPNCGAKMDRQKEGK